MAKVLIVEVHPLTANIVRAFFNGTEHTASAVLDGSAALKALQADVPDVVITDVELPDINGLDLMHIVRKHYGVPVIVISGSGSGNGDYCEMARQQGAVEALLQPITLDQIRNAVDKALTLVSRDGPKSQ